MRWCRLYFSLGAWLFLLPVAGGQEILQPPPLAPPKTVLSPQPFVGDNPSPPTARDLRPRDIDLEIRTPTGTRVLIPQALRSSTDESQTKHRFKIPSGLDSPEIMVEGPFGGKIDAELRLGKGREQGLEIKELPVVSPSANPDPASLSALPALCPRLVSSKDAGPLGPETAVYDGAKDWMSVSQKGSNALYLNRAELNFDFEDPSILVAFNLQNHEWIFEKEGGFYSNLHYAVFPYNEKLKDLLEKMEPDLEALRALEKRLRDQNFDPGELMEMQKRFQRLQASLYGRGSELGPYQLLMNLIFGTLSSTPAAGKAQDLGSPIVHGFLPGPFLGSVHFNYPLCEWGDTARQAPRQAMNYVHFPLWTWKGPEEADEKRILILLEGDEQLKKNPSRLAWEKAGALRSFDYTDDLIGYFVVDRQETLAGKRLTTPFDFISLQVKTE